MVHPRCDVIVQVRDANLSLEKVWSYAPLHIIYARVHKTNLSTETYYALVSFSESYWVLLVSMFKLNPFYVKTKAEAY